MNSKVNKLWPRWDVVFPDVYRTLFIKQSLFWSWAKYFLYLVFLILGLCVALYVFVFINTIPQGDLLIYDLYHKLMVSKINENINIFIYFLFVSFYDFYYYCFVCVIQTMWQNFYILSIDLIDAYFVFHTATAIYIYFQFFLELIWLKHYIFSSQDLFLNNEIYWDFDINNHPLFFKYKALSDIDAQEKAFLIYHKVFETLHEPLKPYFQTPTVYLTEPLLRIPYDISHFSYFDYQLYSIANLLENLDFYNAFEASFDMQLLWYKITLLKRMYLLNLLNYNNFYYNIYSFFLKVDWFFSILDFKSKGYNRKLIFFEELLTSISSIYKNIKLIYSQVYFVFANWLWFRTYAWSQLNWWIYDNINLKTTPFLLHGFISRWVLPVLNQTHVPFYNVDKVAFFSMGYPQKWLHEELVHFQAFLQLPFINLGDKVWTWVDWLEFNKQLPKFKATNKTLLGHDIKPYINSAQNWFSLINKYDYACSVSERHFLWSNNLFEVNDKPLYYLLRLPDFKVVESVWFDIVTFVLDGLVDVFDVLKNYQFNGIHDLITISWIKIWLAYLFIINGYFIIFLINLGPFPPFYFCRIFGVWSFCYYLLCPICLIFLFWISSMILLKTKFFLYLYATFFIFLIELIWIIYWIAKHM